MDFNTHPVWQKLCGYWLDCHWWQKVIARMISVMSTAFTTTLTIALTVLVVVPIAAVVYRTHRKVGDPHPIPLGHLVAIATRDHRSHHHRPTWRDGPDADRIAVELTTLQQYRRDGS